MSSSVSFDPRAARAASVARATRSSAIRNAIATREAFRATLDANDDATARVLSRVARFVTSHRVELVAGGAIGFLLVMVTTMAHWL